VYRCGLLPLLRLRSWLRTLRRRGRWHGVQTKEPAQATRWAAVARRRHYCLTSRRQEAAEPRPRSLWCGRWRNRSAHAAGRGRCCLPPHQATRTATAIVNRTIHVGAVTTYYRVTLAAGAADCSVANRVEKSTRLGTSDGLAPIAVAALDCHEGKVRRPIVLLSKRARHRRRGIVGRNAAAVCCRVHRVSCSQRLSYSVVLNGSRVAIEQRL